MALKIRFKSLFPSRVLGSTGIDIAKTGGTYDFSLDFNEIANNVSGIAAIGYTFDTSITDADPGSGKIRVDSATQNVATQAFIDLFDRLGNNLTSVIDAFDDSTNTIKGTLTLTKFNDQTKWLTFQLTAVTTASGYRKLALTNIGSSTASPFANGDSIALVFSRAGDIGLTTIGSNTITAIKLATSAFGFQDGMINGTLVPSVGSSALTVAIKTLAGIDPTDADPVYVIFRNATIATGDYTVITLTAATSLIVSSGSTLGTANGVPFRLWIVGFNDGGTFRLGAVNCTVGGATPTQIFPLDEASLQSSTTEGGAGAADTAGVYYTGTGATSKAVRILGFLEWASGLGTAGTWSAVPTKTQLFGSGVKLPGGTVQVVVAGTQTTQNITSATYSTAITANITPTSAVNLVRLDVGGSSAVASAGLASGHVTAFRSATQIASSRVRNSSGSSIDVGLGLTRLDNPQTAASVTYAVKVKGDGANSCQWPVAGDLTAGFDYAHMVLTELQT